MFARQTRPHHLQLVARNVNFYHSHNFTWAARRLPNGGTRASVSVHFFNSQGELYGTTRLWKKDYLFNSVAEMMAKATLRDFVAMEGRGHNLPAIAAEKRRYIRKAV